MTLFPILYMSMLLISEQVGGPHQAFEHAAGIASVADQSAKAPSEDGNVP